MQKRNKQDSSLFYRQLYKMLYKSHNHQKFENETSNSLVPACSQIFHKNLMIQRFSHNSHRLQKLILCRFSFQVELHYGRFDSCVVSCNEYCASCGSVYFGYKSQPRSSIASSRFCSSLRTSICSAPDSHRSCKLSFYIKCYSVSSPIYSMFHT